MLRGELAQDELLDDGANHTTAGTNQGTAKHQARATVFAWIIGIRNGARGQVATYAGIVDLLVPVVCFGDKCDGERVQQTRLRGAGTLVEVAGVLVQERGQHGAANQDIGVASGEGCSQTLTVRVGTLTVAGVVAQLIDSGT